MVYTSVEQLLWGSFPEVFGPKVLTDVFKVFIHSAALSKNCFDSPGQQVNPLIRFCFILHFHIKTVLEQLVCYSITFWYLTSSHTFLSANQDTVAWGHLWFETVTSANIWSSSPSKILQWTKKKKKELQLPKFSRNQWLAQLPGNTALEHSGYYSNHSHYCSRTQWYHSYKRILL